MKIGEARGTYGMQLKAYNMKKWELAQKKKELDEKIQKTENGATVFKNEAAVLELQYNAVAEKQNEYQEYMDKLMEQWNNEVNMISGEQQADAMSEYAKDMGKIMTVARRIMRGDKVPQKDEKKLMEFDEKLYAMAKNAGALAQARKRKEHKSLWEDEEQKEYPDALEEADNTEAFADGPQVVDVEVTLESATADMDFSAEA